jgi:hypothetical protein
MENSNRRIIKMLDTIPKFETYSQYSTSLEKVFQDYSFKYLLKNLREQRKPKIYSYFNVEEKKPETNNIFQQYGIQKKSEENKFNLLNDEEDIDIKNNEKDNSLIKKETWKIPIIKSKKRYNSELDPFRYNPNYNSIFKNTPSVRITRPLNETVPINKYKFKIKNRNKLIEPEGESPFLTEVGDIAISSSLSTKNKKPKNFGNLKVKKINLNSEENDRNNHSIRFDKYVDRKIIKSEVNPNVSYIEPFDYQKAKNNSIDFSKMHSRYDDMLFLNLNNIKGPSIGYYNPNYNYFDNKMRNISLGNETRKEKDKKYLLKKLWGSYKVKVDYDLVDNNVLNKTGLRDIIK